MISANTPFLTPFPDTDVNRADCAKHHHDEAMPDEPAPLTAALARVGPPSEALSAWPLTGSWWLISGTPW
jgi:hypothetical protein